MAKEMGDRQVTANALTNLGNVYAGQGRVAEAIGLHREALLIFEALGFQPSAAAAHFNLACALAEERALQDAVSEAKAALSIYQQIHYPAESMVNSQLAAWLSEIQDPERPS